MTEQTTTPDPDAEAEAQAKAEAEAEAAAKAQIGKDRAAFDAQRAQIEAIKAEQAAAADKPASPRKGRKPKPAVASADTLREAIAQVEAGNHDRGRYALVEDMKAAGAVLDEGEGETLIDWHGIRMHAPTGLPHALTVWCSKARRAVLSGEAE